MTMQMSGGNDTDFQLAGVSGPTRLEVEGIPDELGGQGDPARWRRRDR